MAHKCKSSYLKDTSICDPDCWVTSKDEKLMTQVLWHDNGLVEIIQWRDLGTKTNQFIVFIYHRDNPTNVITMADEYLTIAQTTVRAQAQALIPVVV